MTIVYRPYVLPRYAPVRNSVRYISARSRSSHNNQTVQEHFKSKASAEAQGSWGTRYVVDDTLRTRIPPQSFDLIHDCGTLDSIAMTLSPPAAPFDPFAPPGP